MAGQRSENEREAARLADGWLDTVGADTAATFAVSPTSTIVPTIAHSTGGNRALALLAEIAKRDATGGAVELRVGDVIAEGGMGVIRAAEQVALARQVAVKTLKPARSDASGALDLLREAWISGSLEHPNIVPVHHLGADTDGMPLLVLKRSEGVEWSALRANAAEVERRFGATDLLAWNLGILLQVLNALRFAHSKGVLHRDLKPSNVMVGDFGEVYLLDWGIAVSTRDDASGRFPLARDATSLAGTPCYMAPEMLGRDDGLQISELTDVYLAGAVLFELITGAPPHQGANAVTVITSVLTSQPELPPTVPAELATICRRAMQLVPSDRFASVDAMRLALQGYLEHRVSAQIAARASGQLEDLMIELAATAASASTVSGAPDPAPQREAVYRQLGACRAGFQEALAVWRDNRDALAGLVRATVAVADYELASGDARAAVRLLGELDDPPQKLLADARAAAVVHAARQRDLEQLDREHDPNLGKRTRWFVIGLAGIVFTLLPWIAGRWPNLVKLHSPTTLVWWSVGLMCAFGVALWITRDSMLGTAINRHVAISLLFMMGSQVLLAAGGAWAGMPIDQVEMLLPLVYAVIAGMAAITIDPYLTPTAIAYSAAFLVASRWPPLRYNAVAAANLVFTVNVLWRWRPTTLARNQKL